MIGITKFSGRRIAAAELILLLVTAVTISAQVPLDWTVNPSDFEHIMTITARLEFNGSVSGDSNDVVAALTGNECRGVATPINVQGQWLYFMMVRANGNGELILFNVWDADLDTVVVATNQIYFTADEAHGTVNVPYVIDAVNTELATGLTIGLPAGISLFQNYPNPFNPKTTFSYELPRRTYVKLIVLDLQGRLVHTLVDDFQNPGYYTLPWNARNNMDKHAGTGVYFYQLQVENNFKTGRMILLK